MQNKKRIKWTHAAIVLIQKTGVIEMRKQEEVCKDMCKKLEVPVLLVHAGEPDEDVLNLLRTGNADTVLCYRSSIVFTPKGFLDICKEFIPAGVTILPDIQFAESRMLS